MADVRHFDSPEVEVDPSEGGGQYGTPDAASERPIICNISITVNCTHPVYMDDFRFTVPVYGYVSPVVVLLTIVTNTFICLVLLRKNMRSPTNLLLVSMAISDMLTGLFPVPIFLYFYTLGHYADYVPFDWCYVSSALTLHVPTVCHTASIWLTVVLSVQRYICVCHSQRAKTLCTIPNALKAIAAVYAAAIVSQLTRFFEYSYEPVELVSLVDPSGPKIVGCFQSLVSFVRENLELVFGSYWWFRVVFIHLIPCVVLVVFNALLFHAMRAAQQRHDQLLRLNRKTSETRRLAESNLATLMLVAVIGVFLLVEFPLAVLMMTLIYENTFDCLVMEPEERRLASLFINLFILLSYPVNFFIYCGMSRQFRETFKALFTGSYNAISGATQAIEMQSKTSLQVV